MWPKLSEAGVGFQYHTCCYRCWTALQAPRPACCDVWAIWKSSWLIICRYFGQPLVLLKRRRLAVHSVNNDKRAGTELSACNRSVHLATASRLGVRRAEPSSSSSSSSVCSLSLSLYLSWHDELSLSVSLSSRNAS